MSVFQGYLFVFAFAQALALAFMWPTWRQWRGTETSWVEDRRLKGWPCFMMSGFAMFWQMSAFTMLAPMTGVDDLYLVAGATFFFVGPMFFVFAFVWAPRFVLPKWIRERLAAGDPVRTAYPPNELRSLMTCERNFPEREWLPRPEQFVLPTVLRENRFRWWFGGLVATGAAVLLFSWIFRVPLPLIGVFGSESSLVFRVLMFAFVPVMGAFGFYFLRGAVLPERVTVTGEGLRTRSWQLGWEEIETVLSGQLSVVLEVGDEAFQRCREGNRWTSGIPLGMGGFLRGDSRVYLQSAMRDGNPRIHALLDHLLHERTGRGRSVQDFWESLYEEPMPDELVPKG